MPTMNMKMSPKLRRLLAIKTNHETANYLNKNRSKKSEVIIPLSLLHTQLIKFWKDNPEWDIATDDIPTNLKDAYGPSLLHELHKMGSITLNWQGEGDGPMPWVASVNIKIPSDIKEVCRWVNHTPHIINYGVFSLNTVTGETYCDTHPTRLHPSRGLYKVYKKLLTSTDHKLTYHELIKTHKDNVVNDKASTIEANQIAKDLRQALNMKGELSKLLRPVEKAYFLFPDTFKV